MLNFAIFGILCGLSMQLKVHLGGLNEKGLAW